MVGNVAVFCACCATAALLFDLVSTWCFAVPPLLGLAAVRARAEFSPPPR